jgi:protein O-mannosyl-transferase
VYLYFRALPILPKQLQVFKGAKKIPEYVYPIRIPPKILMPSNDLPQFLALHARNDTRITCYQYFAIFVKDVFKISRKVKVQKRSQENNATTQPAKRIENLTSRKPFKKGYLLWVIFVAFVVFIAFYPSLKNGLTNWDDDQYIIKNPWLKELSQKNIQSIFSEYYMGNYHPLAMLSLSIDYQIGGSDSQGEIKPWIYHFTNLLLHIFNTLLVFWLVYLLFYRLEIAVLTSLLFGLSTLHVESVAWVSERKDVLYAFFFVAALIAYVFYIQQKKFAYYLYAIVLFSLSLLSKGQAVSLAISLFAIDYLFGRKLLDKKVLLEKLPFLLLAMIFGVIAIKAQQAGNAMHDSDSYEFYKRIGFAGYAYTQYMVKLVIPSGLSAINPYPDILNRTIPAYYWLFMIPALLSVYAFFYYLKRTRAISFGIAFFIINIFLLLQLIPVGSAIWADRYSYIPSIGFYIVIAWLIVLLVEKSKNKAPIVYTLTGAYLLIIGYASYERCKIWENGMILWNDTIKKSPNAVVAWNNRGSLKDKAKDHNGAIDDFTQAIMRKPDYTHAYYNRGTAKKNYAEKTRDSLLVVSAIADLGLALKMEPLFSEAYRNRGLANELLADFAQTSQKKDSLLMLALKDQDEAIRVGRETESILVSRGVVKGKLNQFDEAIEDFNKAIALSPDSSQAWSNRGLAKDFKGDFNGAISDYSQAIRLKPSFDKAFYNRGITYRKLKDYDKSNADFVEATRLSPGMADAWYYMALNYIDLNNKKQACEFFENARKNGHRFADFQIEKFCK